MKLRTLLHFGAVLQEVVGWGDRQLAAEFVLNPSANMVPPSIITSSDKLLLWKTDYRLMSCGVIVFFLLKSKNMLLAQHHMLQTSQNSSLHPLNSYASFTHVDQANDQKVLKIIPLQSVKDCLEIQTQWALKLCCVKGCTLLRALRVCKRTKVALERQL